MTDHDVPRVGFSAVQAWLIVAGVVLVAVAIATTAIVLTIGVADNKDEIQNADAALDAVTHAVELIRHEQEARIEQGCTGAQRAVAAFRALVEFDDGIISDTDRAAIRIVRDVLLLPECE